MSGLDFAAQQETNLDFSMILKTPPPFINGKDEFTCAYSLLHLHERAFLFCHVFESVFRGSPQEKEVSHMGAI